MFMTNLELVSETRILRNRHLHLQTQELNQVSVFFLSETRAMSTSNIGISVGREGRRLVSDNLSRIYLYPDILVSDERVIVSRKEMKPSLSSTRLNKPDLRRQIDGSYSFITECLLSR